MIDYCNTSKWRSFFTYQIPSSNELPRESGSDMLAFEWTEVRAANEIRLLVLNVVSYFLGKNVTSADVY